MNKLTIAAVICGSMALSACEADVSTTTVTTKTVTRTTEVQEVRNETRKREKMRVCVLDFEYASTLGQQRFLSGKNAQIKIPKAMTLVDADRKSVDAVMQGWVRVVDAESNLRTDDANRAAQTGDNAFNRQKALAVYNETVKGEARPIVIGADYLEGYLGRYPDAFACVGRRGVTAAMAKIAAEPDFPRDYLARLGKACGITHLIAVTVSDIRSQENGSKGYGIETKTTNYQLDVIVKVIDLSAQASVYSDVFTGTYREQRPISGEQFDNNIYQRLMNNALAKAAERLNALFGPEKPEGAADMSMKTKFLPAACAQSGEAPVGGGIQPTEPTAGGIQPTDQIAVAETANKGGLPAETVDAFSDMLESEIEVGRLVTRAGLKQMMAEIGFTTSSDLIDPSETQMAKLGQIKGVKYLVLPTISKFGSRYTLAIKVVESSTGAVLPGGRASQSFNTLDEMADVLPGLLERIGLKGSAAAPGAPAPAGFKAAVLTPLVKVAAPPDYLKENLNVYLEQMLIANGVRLQNLKSVDAILQKNGIGALDNAEPALYRRIGQLLGVDKLVQATVTRFSVVQQSQYIAVTRQTVVTCTGVIEGNIRIVSAQSGDVVASFSFEQPAQLNGGVDASDYGRNLLKSAIAQLTAQIVPCLK